MSEPVLVNIGKKVQVQLHRYEGTKAERLQQLWSQQWYGCKRCILSDYRINSVGAPFEDIVFGEGNPDAKVMIVGEAPGDEEETTGIPFVGASGKLLNQILAATSDDPGIQELYRWYNNTRHTNDVMEQFHSQMLEWRKKEFFITNVVGCRPPENRTPTAIEVKACRDRLYNIIHIVDPWLIITSGKPAIEGLLHKTVEITKQRGSVFEVDLPGLVTTYRKEVVATLHPAYLLRQADWKTKTGSFMKTLKDFRYAFDRIDMMKQKYLGEPIPYRVPLP